VSAGDRAPDATSVRRFAFVTNLKALCDAHYTVASAFPADLMTPYPLSMVPHLFFDGSLLASPTTTTTTTIMTVAPIAGLVEGQSTASMGKPHPCKKAKE